MCLSDLRERKVNVLENHAGDLKDWRRGFSNSPVNGWGKQKQPKLCCLVA